jgi:dolichol kinase
MATYKDNTPYHKELIRKSLHLTSLWMPASIWLLPHYYAITMIAISFVGVALFELVRRQNNTLSRLLTMRFQFLMRASELTERPAITGAFYMLLAALIMVIFCEADIAIMGLSILMISDSAAALIGKKWGRVCLAGKTLEGCMAFLFSALVIIYAMQQMAVAQNSNIIALIIAAIICTIAECFAKQLRMDDNLLIPLSFAGAYYLALSLL